MPYFKRIYMLYRKYSSKIHNVVVICTFLSAQVYCAYRVVQALQSARIYAANPDYDPERRTSFWIESARCIKKTGIFLVICDDEGKVYPIENVSLADDRGHAILANIYALMKDGVFDKVDLTRINIMLTGVGIMGLSMMLLITRFFVAGFVFPIITAMRAIPGPLPGWDVPSAYIGILCLGVMPIVWVFSFFRNTYSLRTQICGSLVAYGALVWTVMLRQPYGVISVLCCFFGVFLLLRKKHVSVRSIAQLIGLIVVIVSPLLVPTVVLNLRNKIFLLERSKYVESHGISHTLLSGLGTEPNPWGIQWTDAYGYNLIQHINPNIAYCSRGYYRVLGNMYWRIVVRYPVQVLKIYVEKFKKTIFLPFTILGVNYFLFFCMALGFYFLLFRYAPFETQNPLLINVGLSTFFLLFIMQGVLGIPWIKHIYPVKILLFLMNLLFIDHLVLWNKVRISKKI